MEDQPPPQQDRFNDETAITESSNQNGESGIVGSAALRPVFLGNLKMEYTGEDVIAIFHTPIAPSGTPEGTYRPIPVDRLDQKRGYCFVFLKDAVSQEDKDNAERFVAAISGMEVENVSVALRAEFARGDGRIKRKEDDRRRNIHPSETLFVVNFQEETTKREDLKMLFEPFGELVRIDMKRNYAFVQFRTIEEATRAKETTDGGKLDQSVLTVEYVARQRSDEGRRGGGGGGGSGGRFRRDDRRGGGGYRGDRRDVQDRSFRSAPPADRYDRSGGGGDNYDNRGGGGGDRSRGGYRGGSPSGYRDRSPGGHRGASPTAYRSGSPGGYRPASPVGYRRRSRSRSRSPPRSRDDRGGGYSRGASPPRGGGASGSSGAGGGGRYEDRGGRYADDRDRYDEYRGRSPEVYRGRDDRGYRG